MTIISCINTVKRQIKDIQNIKVKSQDVMTENYK